MYCPNPDCPERDDGQPPAEYRADITRCPVCETPLVAVLPMSDPPDREPPTAEDQPAAAAAGDVAVVSTTNLVEADMAAAALEENGIPHYRQRRGLSGLLLGGGVAPAPGQIHVIFVPGAAARDARELLEDLFTEVEGPFDDDYGEPDRPFDDPEPVGPGAGSNVVAFLLAVVAAVVLLGLLLG